MDRPTRPLARNPSERYNRCGLGQKITWPDQGNLIMKRSIFSKGLWRVWVPGSSVLLLGGCGLSDAQLSSIFQSVVQTGLTTLLTEAISSLFTCAAA